MDKPTSITLTVCWRCNGTGVYRWGGGTVNGKFVGHEGPCFKCVGGGEFPRTSGAAWFTRHGRTILASIEAMALAGASAPAVLPCANCLDLALTSELSADGECRACLDAHAEALRTDPAYAASFASAPGRSPSARALDLSDCN